MLSKGKHNKRNKNCTKLWEPWLKTLMPSLPILLFCTQTLLTQLSKGYVVQAVCYPALTTLIFPCLVKYSLERWFFNDWIVFHLKNLSFTIKIKQHVLIDSELGMKYSGLNFPFIYPDFEALGKKVKKWDGKTEIKRDNSLKMYDHFTEITVIYFCIAYYWLLSDIIFMILLRKL